MWYECKVAYTRQRGEGEMRKGTEQYLVDALSCSEAEARVVREVLPFVSSGEIEVKSVKECKISEVFADAGGGTYYKARLNMLGRCPETGRNKVLGPLLVIVESGLVPMGKEELEVAIEHLKANMMLGSSQDWELVKIERTPLMGIVVPETSEGL